MHYGGQMCPSSGYQGFLDLFGYVLIEICS